MVFTIKYGCFCFQFFLKPIHWFLSYPTIGFTNINTKMGWVYQVYPSNYIIPYRMGPPSYKLVYKPWTHWLYLVISTINPIEFSHLFSSATERNNERTGGSGDAPLRSRWEVPHRHHHRLELRGLRRVRLKNGTRSLRIKYPIDTVYRYRWIIYHGNIMGISWEYLYPICNPWCWYI